jgi:hypothetical protein
MVQYNVLNCSFGLFCCPSTTKLHFRSGSYFVSSGVNESIWTKVLDTLVDIVSKLDLKCPRPGLVSKVMNILVL